MSADESQDGPHRRVEGHGPSRPTPGIPAPAPQPRPIAPSRSARSKGGGFFQDRKSLIAIEGYEIIREISRGGQGVVYQALQKSTHRNVAIKVLMEGPFASRNARKRFEREVDVAAGLKHPHIIVVFDSGTTSDDHLFYVMDYVDGVPITHYIRDNKLRLEQVLELVATACDAVNYAHQKGVIHRDLKPGNILMDREGSLRILDFGLAKVVTGTDDQVSVTGHGMVGTLPYMSPEQTRGTPELVDIRTDVYALGVVLYELLTGAYPYPVVGEMAEVLKHITTTEPRSLSRNWAEGKGISKSGRTRSGCPINNEVKTISLKALSKERERRYQSAGDLAKDIRRYLANEPIDAKRDSVVYLLRKAVWRYRSAAAAAAAFVMLLILAVVVLSAALHKTAEAERAALHERDRANQQRDRADTKAREAQDNLALARENEKRADAKTREAQDNLTLARENEKRADAKAREAQDNLTLAQRNERLAEIRLADGLLFAGDGQMRSGEPGRARESYFTALDLSRKLGKPDLSMLAALLQSYDSDAPPLMGDDGARQTIGGFSGHTAYVFCAAISPDGRNAISAAMDRTLRLWDVASGREIRKLTGHTASVQCAVFLPDGQSVLSGSMDGKLKLWDIANGTELRSFSGHRGAVYSVALSPDGRNALSGSGDKTLKLWDLSGREIRSFSGHTGGVFSVAFSPDGQSIISGGDDHTLRLWSTSSGKETRRFIGHGARVYVVTFSPDGRSILSGGLDGTLRLWDAGTAREIRIFAGRGSILSAAFSSDGRKAVSGRSAQTLRLSDVASGDEIRSFLRHLESVRSVVFSPDDQCILSGSDDKTLKLWDVANGKEIRRFPGRTCGALAFSPDGRTILYCDSKRMLKLLDVATQKDILSFAGSEGGVDCVAFSPDGRSTLSGGSDKMVRLWDAFGGSEIRSFSGHTGIVRSVAFSSDGRTAISGGEDKTIKLCHNPSVSSQAAKKSGRF